MMSGPGLLFVSATAMEVQAFVDRHDSRQTEGPGYTLFQSPGKDWACLVTGPGVFNTAAGLGACLSKFTPDMVIDVGIAGVFPGSGLNIGDLALAEGESYLHTGEALPLPFDLIPGRPDTRKGEYPLDSRAAETCSTGLKAAGFGVIPSGLFLTVSAITDSAEKAEELFSARPYLMESMEGAAAAHVCALYGVPMAEIRAGSNITGERDGTRWDIPAACHALDRALTALKKVASGE